MKRLIIAITVLFIQNKFYSQSTLHHQSIAAQVTSKTLSNGFVINQTIGQQSVIGNSKTGSNIIFQGFQQSQWGKLISTSSKSNISVKVYPNPFVNQLNFQFSKEINDKVRIQIFDFNGRLILDESKYVEDFYLTIDLTYLPAASYLVKVYASKINYYSKIIKRE